MGKRIQRSHRTRREIRKTILLVTNGALTEKTYLESLKARVPRHTGPSIKVDWHDGKEPETILKRLAQHRGSIAEYDEVWIIVDHDGRDRHNFLSDCARIRPAKVFGVISVPCFEV